MSSKERTGKDPARTSSGTVSKTLPVLPLATAQLSGHTPLRPLARYCPESLGLYAWKTLIKQN